MAVEVFTRSAALVGCQPGMLDSGSTDLLDSAVCVDPIHVPDQEWMLVISVGRVVAGEFAEPGNPRGIQGRAGAKGTLTRDGCHCGSVVDVVAQGRIRRKHDAAASVGSGIVLLIHATDRNILHEQIGLVGTAGLAGNRIAMPVAWRWNSVHVVHTADTLPGHLGKYLEVGNRHSSQFRMPGPLRQRRRCAHVGGVNGQNAIVVDQLVHELVDIEPGLAITADNIQPHRICLVRAQAEIDQRN